MSHKSILYPSVPLNCTSKRNKSRSPRLPSTTFSAKPSLSCQRDANNTRACHQLPFLRYQLKTDDRNTDNFQICYQCTYIWCVLSTLPVAVASCSKSQPTETNTKTKIKLQPATKLADTAWSTQPLQIRATLQLFYARRKPQ